MSIETELATLSSEVKHLSESVNKADTKFETFKREMETKFVDTNREVDSKFEKIKESRDREKEKEQERKEQEKRDEKIKHDQDERDKRTNRIQVLVAIGTALIALATAVFLKG